MLAPIKGALAGIRFHPNGKIECGTIDLLTGLEQLTDVAPIHADKVNGAIARYRRGFAERILQKFNKFAAGKLAGAHNEFAMLDPAASHDVTDRNVVGRIHERHRGLAAAHQEREVAFTAGICAEQAVLVQVPEVAQLGHGWCRSPRGIERVGGIGRVFLEVCGELINLGRIESGNCNIEIILDEKPRQLREFACKQLTVPAGIRRDFVVSQGQSAFSGCRKAADLDDGDKGESELHARLVAAVTAENAPCLIGDDRHDKAKLPDALGNLADLFFRMGVGVATVRFEGFDGDVLDLHDS